MYALLWRTLPGPWPVKALQSLVLIGGVCVLLMLVVFPWVEPKLPFSDNVVDGSVPASTAEPTDGGDAGTGGDTDAAETDEPDGEDADADEPDSEDGADGETDDGGDQITLPGDG